MPASNSYPYAGLARNYCRNPTVYKGDWSAWCYTTDPGKRWEECDIPMCPGKSKDKDKGIGPHVTTQRNLGKDVFSGSMDVLKNSFELLVFFTPCR